MKNVLLLLAVAVSVVARVHSRRIYYLDNSAGPVRGNEQQASRDLDLSFSAGEPAGNEMVPVAKKVYALAAPERPYVESKDDADGPYYYRLEAEPASRRGDLDDVVLVPASQAGRKLMKSMNGRNKGEVILELRVLAFNDDGAL